MAIFPTHGDYFISHTEAHFISGLKIWWHAGRGSPCPNWKDTHQSLSSWVTSHKRIKGFKGKGNTTTEVKCLSVTRTKHRVIRHEASLTCRKPEVLHAGNTAATQCYHLLNTILFDRSWGFVNKMLHVLFAVECVSAHCTSLWQMTGPSGVGGVCWLVFYMPRKWNPAAQHQDSQDI